MKREKPWCLAPIDGEEPEELETRRNRAYFGMTLLLDTRRLLKPGGLLAAGFSPLYFSPFGDHGRLQLKIPWLHAVLPEALLIRRLERRTGRTLIYVVARMPSR